MVDLFGEPERQSALSQFFTPMWVARRAARWLPRDGYVLEPSAGRGNLIQAAVEVGIPPDRVMACEIDDRWATVLRERWPELDVYVGDFMSAPVASAISPRVLTAFMNPPYEQDADVDHVVRAVERCRGAIAIVKSDFEFSQTRDSKLWRWARPVRRAILVDRPQFGETDKNTASDGPARNYVVLQIVPADVVGTGYAVLEERWRRNDAPEAP